MNPHRVLIVGRGRFARTLLASLSSTLGLKVQIAQCYRDNQGLPAASPSPTMRSVQQIPMHTLLGDKGAADLCAVMTNVQPDIVVVAASCYSPYATTFKSDAPFGASLPYQIPVALNVSMAVQASGVNSLLLNACYPEMVNPIARLLGAPFDAGLGNAQTLNWAQDYSRPDKGLSALAHHSHLGNSFQEEPLMYDAHQGVLREAREEQISALKKRRALSRPQRNDLGAVAAAALVSDLVSAPLISACLPGVGAETGAVPVRLQLGSNSKARIELSEPDRLRVRARHHRECLKEGWLVENEVLELTPQAYEGMGSLAPAHRVLGLSDLRAWIDVVGRSL